MEVPWNFAGMLGRFFAVRKIKCLLIGCISAVYLDTEDQDTIQYIFNIPKNNVSNNDDNNIEIITKQQNLLVML